VLTSEEMKMFICKGLVGGLNMNPIQNSLPSVGITPGWPIATSEPDTSEKNRTNLRMECLYMVVVY
jgi:hypothetical protein